MFIREKRALTATHTPENIYIYIYIYFAREREREREGGRGGGRGVCVCVYVFICHDTTIVLVGPLLSMKGSQADETRTDLEVGVSGTEALRSPPARLRPLQGRGVVHALGCGALVNPWSSLL